MEEQKIIYETAKSAKEKGFDTQSNYLYGWVQQDGGKPKKIELIERDIKEYTNFKHRKNDDLCISVPQSQLQTWLRTEYNIHMTLKPFYDTSTNETTFVCDVMKLPSDGKIIKSPRLKSYEEVLELGLQEGLKLIKEI